MCLSIQARSVLDVLLPNVISNDLCVGVVSRHSALLGGLIVDFTGRLPGTTRRLTDNFVGGPRCHFSRPYLGLQSSHKYAEQYFFSHVCHSVSVCSVCNF